MNTTGFCVTVGTRERRSGAPVRRSLGLLRNGVTSRLCKPIYGARCASAPDVGRAPRLPLEGCGAPHRGQVAPDISERFSSASWSVSCSPLILMVMENTARIEPQHERQPGYSPARTRVPSGSQGGPMPPTSGRSRQRCRDRELARFRRAALADSHCHPLRRARLEAGLTTAELARKADRLSPGTIGQIERRNSPGTPHTRATLARVLRRPLKELFE